ncbi:MAG: M28 family peptidase [Verrucomicrobia bacterium]|nr:M28 family peptidase [Verrucomicrobiota bacterium]
MNEFRGDNAYKVLTSIAYPRQTGTEGEHKAAKMLAKHFTSYGLDGTLEPYRIWTYTNDNGTVEVLEPYKKKYEAAVVGRSPDLPKGGLECGFVYAEDGSPQYLAKVKGKAVLLTGGGFEQMKQLLDRGALAILRVGAPHLLPFRGMVGEPMLTKVGALPGLNLRFEDALEMVKKKASRVRLKMDLNNFEAVSNNVTAEVRGTEVPDEAIVIVAHYDTVSGAVGGHDNGAGTAIIVEIARCLAKNPLKRTVRFACMAGEEYGLYGSRHYVQRHKGELDNYRLCLNCDVAGMIIGRNRIEVTGPDSLRWYLEGMSHELGFGCGVGTDAYSSDNIPFSAEGVPAASFARYGGYVSEGHTVRDGIEDIDAEHLAITGRFMLEFLKRVGNAVEFPFKREIPDEHKKKVDEYVEHMHGRQYKPLAKLKPPAGGTKPARKRTR